MADFSRLLATAPGSCSEIRRELEAICGTSFSGSTYGALWKSLVAQLGEPGATALVENTVKIRTARKVLMRGSQRSVVNALLTQMIEKARRAALGHLRKNVVIPPRVARRPNHVASFEHSLPILLPTGVRLKGRSNWLEANLEDYLWKHWDTIDYQLGAPIEPLGRQARLNDSMEKVDFLAKSVENVYFPIELKIKPASGSDFTQVQSYRQDLINRGVQSVIGVLVAPGFSTKVINVARGQTDILLRTIDMPVRRGS